MLFNCEFRIEIIDKKYKTKRPPIHEFRINYLKTKCQYFFSLSHQGGKGSHVTALEVYIITALEVYTITALEVYTITALEVYTITALEVYTVTALEVSKLFTGGDKTYNPQHTSSCKYTVLKSKGLN